MLRAAQLGLPSPHLLQLPETVNHRLHGTCGQGRLGSLRQAGAPHNVTDAPRHGVVTVAGIGIDFQHFLQVGVGPWTGSILLKEQENSLWEKLQVVELGHVVEVLLKTALQRIPLNMLF